MSLSSVSSVQGGEEEISSFSVVSLRLFLSRPLSCNSSILYRCVALEGQRPRTRLKGEGERVSGSVLRVRGLRVRVQGSGFRVKSEALYPNMSLNADPNPNGSPKPNSYPNPLLA